MKPVDCDLSRDYATPADFRPEGWACWWPEACLYSKIIRIVLWSAKLAKRGQYDQKLWHLASLNTLRAMECCGCRVKVENLRVLSDCPGPVVIVGNHMSTAETFILGGLVGWYKPSTFVIKKSLTEYPVFRHVIKTLHPIVVSRKNPKEDLETVLYEGEARLRQGITVIVFPQTTRTVHFAPEQFNSIGVKLARRAGVPVVPLALRTDAWGNGRWIKDFGPVNPRLPVHFAFAEPLVITGNGKIQQEKIVAFIESKLRVWGVPIG